MHVKKLMILLAFMSAAHGQLREEIKVEVIEVPVYVHHDKDVIRDLTRDRFELLVNGKPHPIDYFDVIDLGEADAKAPAASAPAATVAAPRDLRQRRLFLLVFDLVFSRPEALVRARKAAMRLIHDSPQGDAFAVATHNATKGLQFIVPFTNDRIAATRAVQKLSPANAEDPLRIQMGESDREAIKTLIAEAQPEEMIDPVSGGGDVIQELRKEPTKRLIEHQLNTISLIGSRLKQLDGRKHIVVFSEGFNPNLVYDVPRNRNRTMGAPQLDATLTQTLGDMYKTLQDADTFVHAVDIAGLRHTWDPLVNDALGMLSSGTGGTFVRNVNNLGAALNELQQSHRFAYVLGFRPRNPRDGHNRIEVKVKNLPRGTTVSYRRGFSTDPPSRSIDALRLADILMNDIPHNAIRTALGRTADGVALAIPTDSWSGVRTGQSVEVMLYVFDESGGVIESRSVRVGPESEVFLIPIKQKPGKYVVKTLSRFGDALGFARLPIEITQ